MVLITLILFTLMVVFPLLSLKSDELYSAIDRFCVRAQPKEETCPTTKNIEAFIRWKALFDLVTFVTVIVVGYLVFYNDNNCLKAASDGWGYVSPYQTGLANQPRYNSYSPVISPPMVLAPTTTPLNDVAQQPMSNYPPYPYSTTSTSALRQPPPPPPPPGWPAPVNESNKQAPYITTYPHKTTNKSKAGEERASSNQAQIIFKPVAANQQPAPPVPFPYPNV